ncbi:hypothetical protein [Herbaspirillum sp. alder98]|uniref:hypothetical protein n=1 Tax=Herbaspirillum sp. alder98 TaxID=2913096 RepID=UPI001CD864FB|nr:hypothetical protein [Herbaspirillum sp. alder98]MCA1325093.1 hypothetical protein [Herbaspirillum sp. alder98]
MGEISGKRIWDGTVLLVADPSEGEIPSTEYDRRIDRPLANTVDMIRAALESCGDKVISFSDLSQFTSDINKHPNSLVFPYWFGESSRSRHGLVPAICEASKVMFVGADAYAKVVCNDKELSKTICRQSGLQVPSSAILTTLDDLDFASYLTPPIVVKPNYEGTSLGISDKNLCKSWDEVRRIAEVLFKQLGQPVILEEFIVGREFSACILGNPRSGVKIQVGGWKINGNSDFLNNRLNTFDLKLPSGYTFVFEDLNKSIEQSVNEAFLDCFDRLGKTELLRIDGRITPDNSVVILELTPDIYLGPDGEFCSAFGYNEKTFKEFISQLVTNSLEGYGSSVPMC